MTLRTRIAFMVSMVTAVICILFSGSIVMTGYDTEDQLLRQRLRLSVDRFLQRRALDPQALPQHERLITGWVKGEQPIPDPWPDIFSNLEPGIHELIDEQSLDKKDHWIAKYVTQDGKETWFRYETWQIEDEELGTRKLSLILTVSLVALLTVIAVAWFVVDRRIVRRLLIISESLNQSQNHIKRDTKANDEVSNLANSIVEYQRRIDGFLEREKRLTRDASHELRSPITVIQGALDIIEAHGDKTPSHMHRPLERIRRASDTMGDLVEAFLVAAREDPKPEALTDMNKLCAERMSHLEPLLAAEGKQWEWHEEEQVFLPAWPVAAAVVIDNLLRNGISHSSGDRVSIRLNASSLTIINECHSASRSQGFGYGESIANDFANRLGWNLTREEEGNIFTARCHFMDEVEN